MSLQFSQPSIDSATRFVQFLRIEFPGGLATPLARRGGKRWFSLRKAGRTNRRSYLR